MNNAIELPRLELSGHFRLQVRRDGQLIHDRPVDNLITNGGLESIGLARAICGYCIVGEGNTAPSVSNTTMEDPVANAAASASSQGLDTAATPNFAWGRREYVFAQGAVLGNIAEVGISWENANLGAVFSRALVEPAITLLSIDQLTVTYELRVYVPESLETNDTVTIGGVDYEYWLKPIRVNNNGVAGTNGNGWGTRLHTLGAATREWCQANTLLSWYGAIAWQAPVIDTPITADGMWTTTSVLATSAQNNSVTNSAYEPSTLRCNFQTKFGISHGNFGAGIQGVTFTGMFGTYQVRFDAAIPKDNTKELTFSWRQTWARRP